MSVESITVVYAVAPGVRLKVTRPVVKATKANGEQSATMDTASSEPVKAA